MNVIQPRTLSLRSTPQRPLYVDVYTTRDNLHELPLAPRPAGTKHETLS